MGYCRERSIVNSGDGRYAAVSLKCRAWTCPNCTDMRQKQLVAQACGGEPNTFLTLTSRVRPSLTPNEAAARLSHAWRLLRLRLMRKYKLKRLPFLAVCEATKAGWPHLHILLRAPYLDWKFIKAVMQDLDDSPVIDIQRIDHKGRIAGYVAKYAGKAVHKFGTSKRYWQSQDYDLRPDADPRAKPLPGAGWEQWSWDIKRIARSWEELGWKVEWASHDKVIAIDPERWR